MKAAVHNIVWGGSATVGSRLRLTYQHFIGFKSIICHLELEHGWITNNKYVSGLVFIQVASHQEWYLEHEVPLQLAGLGPDLDVVHHLHHEQAPLPHQHRGRQPGPERKY